MKKKTQVPRLKLNPNTTAKNMKKQLGEFHAIRVVKDLANSIKNVSMTDINTKDFFDIKDVKRNQLFWEQVANILQK